MTCESNTWASLTKKSFLHKQSCSSDQELIKHIRKFNSYSILMMGRKILYEIFKDGKYEWDKIFVELLKNYTESIITLSIINGKYSGRRNIRKEDFIKLVIFAYDINSLQIHSFNLESFKNKCNVQKSTLLTKLKEEKYEDVVRFSDLSNVTRSYCHSYPVDPNEIYRIGFLFNNILEIVPKAEHLIDTFCGLPWKKFMKVAFSVWAIAIQHSNGIIDLNKKDVVDYLLKNGVTKDEMLIVLQRLASKRSDFQSISKEKTPAQMKYWFSIKSLIDLNDGLFVLPSPNKFYFALEYWFWYELLENLEQNTQVRKLFEKTNFGSLKGSIFENYAGQCSTKIIKIPEKATKQPDFSYENDSHRLLVECKAKLTSGYDFNLTYEGYIKTVDNTLIAVKQCQDFIKDNKTNKKNVVIILCFEKYVNEYILISNLCKELNLLKDTGIDAICVMDIEDFEKHLATNDIDKLIVEIVDKYDQSTSIQSLFALSPLKVCMIKPFVFTRDNILKAHFL